MATKDNAKWWPTGSNPEPCLAVTPDTSGTQAGQLLPGLAGIAHPNVEVPLLRARRIGRARRNPFGDPLNASRRRPGSKPMTTQPPVSSLTLIAEPGSRLRQSAQAGAVDYCLVETANHPKACQHAGGYRVRSPPIHASVEQAAPIPRGLCLSRLVSSCSGGRA
jgi:hypothetical protein